MKTKTEAELAADLYQTVEAEASRFSAVSTLTAEDVRQTLYTFCLERAAGADKYNPLLGDPRTYVLGRMWGLIERWRGREGSLDDESDDDSGMSHAVVPPALRSPGVEQQLIEAEQRRVVEAVLEDMDRTGRQDREHLVTVVAAICGSGLAERAAERLWGGNSGRMRQRLREARRQWIARQGDNSRHDQPRA